MRVCIIENEGPPGLFQQKLAAKIASWDGPDFAQNVFVFTGPWGEFSFADPEAREALVAFCEEHAIDVVTANPTLGLGVAASGRPDETQQFVDWLVECGLKSERAFWLLHHENKAGQIWATGAATRTRRCRSSRTATSRARSSTGRRRAGRRSRSETTPKVCMLEWVDRDAGLHGHRLDTVGASDTELEERIVDLPREHPLRRRRTPSWRT